MYELLAGLWLSHWMTKLHEFQQKPQEEQTGDNIGLLSDALKKDAESVADQWKNCSNPSLRAILSSKGEITTYDTLLQYGWFSSRPQLHPSK